MRILAIEGEEPPFLLPRKKRKLAKHGILVDVLGTVGDSDAALMTIRYDAVVLDRRLPGSDGLDLLGQMRRRGDATPVLMLSASEGLDDRLACLARGADGYLLKPFDIDELIARLQALTRRPPNIRRRMVVFGNISLDADNRQVSIGSAICPVPTRELALLEILLRHGGRVMARSSLDGYLFNRTSQPKSCAVSVYVHRLRERLAAAGATPRIETVTGVGYLLTHAKSS